MRERIIQMDWVLLLKVGQRRRAGMEGPRRQLRNSADYLTFREGGHDGRAVFLFPSERMTRCSSESRTGLSLLSTCIFFQPADCLQLKGASGSEPLSKQYPFTAGIPLGGINSRLKANTRFVINFSLSLFFFLLGCINCGSLCGCLKS